MRIKTRKYGSGETLPNDVCPGCRNHKKSRSGMGTCGHRDCIDYLNTISIKGATKDERDPATNASFRHKRTGKVYKGSFSFGEGSKTGVKMKDGSSHRLSDLEAMD